MHNQKTFGKLKYLWKNRNLYFSRRFSQCYSQTSQNEVICQRKQQSINNCRFINSLAFTTSESKYDSVSLPSQAKVVICGGGVMGAAVAYHLGLQGWGRDTVILDQSR